jgi:hypothetical protein
VLLSQDWRVLPTVLAAKAGLGVTMWALRCDVCSRLSNATRPSPSRPIGVSREQTQRVTGEAQILRSRKVPCQGTGNECTFADTVHTYVGDEDPASRLALRRPWLLDGKQYE